MAEFLTAEWLDQLDQLAQASADLAGATSERLVIEQRVLRADGDTVVYHLVLGAGPARVHSGAAERADLTLVATEAVALGIHEGSTNAQSCLSDGTLRLRGNPEILARHAAVLDRIGDVFADARR